MTDQQRRPATARPRRDARLEHRPDETTDPPTVRSRPLVVTSPSLVIWTLLSALWLLWCTTISAGTHTHHPEHPAAAPPPRTGGRSVPGPRAGVAGVPVKPDLGRFEIVPVSGVVRVVTRHIASLRARNASYKLDLEGHTSHVRAGVRTRYIRLYATA